MNSRMTIFTVASVAAAAAPALAGTYAFCIMLMVR